MTRQAAAAGRLVDKIAVVTGGAGGLGSAIAERLAEEGASVVVCDRDGERASKVAEQCRRYAPRSAPEVLDVTESAAVTAAFERIERDHGRIDVLVTAAGITSAGDLAAAPARSAAADPDAPVAPRYSVDIARLGDASWRAMLAVHLDGTFYCARAVVPGMQRRRSGSIVCISSIVGLAGVGAIHYAAAKAGILGFVRALARVVAPDGIRVNAVCPGVIDAGMTHLYPRDLVEAFLPQVPMGRLGSARELANGVLHLACDESSYTTGQWLSPNGGAVIM